MIQIIALIIVIAGIVIVDKIDKSRKPCDKFSSYGVPDGRCANTGIRTDCCNCKYRKRR